MSFVLVAVTMRDSPDSFEITDAARANAALTLASSVGRIQ